MAKKIIAFPWYGGKYSKLSWLLPLLPACHHYVEPFGGSAAVLLNRDPSPIETYNDLDGEVVNFFRVLRESPEALIEALTLTPFAREEYRTAVLLSGTGADLERARRFFVRARQSFGALAQSSHPNAWGFAKTKTDRGLSSRTSRWIASIPALFEVVSRLRMAQIENRSALDVVRLYDTADTLFYCDPPYVLDSRKQGSRDVYASEMTDQDHVSLARALTHVQGRVAVSGYESPLYAELYAGWHRSKIAVTSSAGLQVGERRTERTEVLWTNYDPSEREEAAA